MRTFREMGRLDRNAVSDREWWRGFSAGVSPSFTGLGDTMSAPKKRGREGYVSSPFWRVVRGFLPLWCSVRAGNGQCSRFGPFRLSLVVLFLFLPLMSLYTSFLPPFQPKCPICCLFVGELMSLNVRSFLRVCSASVSAPSKLSGGESAFVGSEVYVNRIPDPPCEGKMLRESEEVADMVSYKPTVLESRYRYPILEDAVDYGLHFDLVDVMAWESPWARLEATMPPSKRKKYSDTDPAVHASASSYYQHYQKKNKGEIASNTIMAAKYGRVAAADLVLPFEAQLRSIPKPQQIPLFHRESVAATTTATSVPSASAVTWLKRTEYMSAKDERSINVTSAFVSESLDQLEEFEQRQAQLTGSVESPSSTTASMMDADEQETGAEKDEADRIVDELLAGSNRSESSQTPVKTTKVAVSQHLIKSPFQTDSAKVLREIEHSFDAIASRSAIIHPSDATSAHGKTLSSSQSTHRRLSSSGSSQKASDGPYIVEEWDIFPNELVWANPYLVLQSDIPLPKGELLLLPSSTHTPTLLKPAHTEAENKAAHDTHLVPQRKKEILTSYSKPQESDDKTAEEEGEAQPQLAPNELAFQAHWEVEATSLRPVFDSMGSYVFALGKTTPYDADEDEESGVIYEGDNAQQTITARRRKNESLKRSRVGIATYKDIDARVHLRPPTAETRSAASKLKHPDVVKLVPTSIPDIEKHLRTAAADTLKEQ